MAACAPTAGGPHHTTAVPRSSTTSSSAPGTSTTARSGSGALAADWLTYHHDDLRSGVEPEPWRFGPPTPAWTSPPLDGELFGEPLVDGARVVVATENDTVYALSAADGRVEWSRHLGTPVPAGTLPCGDIEPTVGITSTPVVDAGRHEVFVVAFVEGAAGAAHELVGLDVATGAVRLRQDVDPRPGQVLAQLQRAGLALDDGRVLIGFGGNDGDCGTYHGWLVSVSENGGTARTYEVDTGAGEREGAVWMGGAAPVVDPHGDIWIAVGNGSVTEAATGYDGSDAVIELSPALVRLQFFAPADWAAANAADGDLGSTAPQLLGNGLVLQVGKTETGYLLDAAHLGGVGGQATTATVCRGDADGGDAALGDVVFVPCANGVTEVTAARTPGGPRLSVGWTTATGANRPPIIAGGLVFTVGGAVLYGLDPRTGVAVWRATIGAQANHFPTPSAGDGLLLVGASDPPAVHAFRSGGG